MTDVPRASPLPTPNPHPNPHQLPRLHDRRRKWSCRTLALVCGLRPPTGAHSPQGMQSHGVSKRASLFQKTPRLRFRRFRKKCVRVTTGVTPRYPPTAFRHSIRSTVGGVTLHRRHRHPPPRTGRPIGGPGGARPAGEGVPEDAGLVGREARPVGGDDAHEAVAVRDGDPGRVERRREVHPVRRRGAPPTAAPGGGIAGGHEHTA